MKKQLIPIFVISIISFVFSVIMLGIGIWAIAVQNEMFELVEEHDDGFTMLLGALGSIVIILLAVAVLIAFAVTALLGAFGLICSLKNGRFSLVCLILGSVATLLSLSGIPALLEDITNDFEPMSLIPFVYCGVYTACSIVAFMYRKKVVHEQIMEKPYELPLNEVEDKL